MFCMTFEPRREKTGFFAYAKTRTQISFAVTVKLISAFFFATRIVQSLFYLNSKFKPLTIFCDCTARFVWDLVRNPEDRFSHNEAHLKNCSFHFFLLSLFSHSLHFPSFPIRQRSKKQQQTNKKQTNNKYN